MSRAVDFYKSMQTYRVRFGELRGNDELLKAVIYINTAIHMSSSFELEDFPTLKSYDNVNSLDERDVKNGLFIIENYMNKVFSENIFELDSQLKNDFVYLDDDWKSMATTYVSHIRNTVAKADINEKLRQSIFSKIEELQREIDRNQTRLESLTDTWLELTEAIGQGAKNLRPAVKLIEQLAGSFSKLKRTLLGEQKKTLPPPDKLGLPSPKNDDSENDSEDDQ